jgi:hypothetical protein
MRTATLHVHHVVPRSKGGLTALDNLLTLCERCHPIVEQEALLLRRGFAKSGRRPVLFEPYPGGLKFVDLLRDLKRLLEPSLVGLALDDQAYDAQVQWHVRTRSRFRASHDIGRKGGRGPRGFRSLLRYVVHLILRSFGLSKQCFSRPTRLSR